MKQNLYFVFIHEINEIINTEKMFFPLLICYKTEKFELDRNRQKDSEVSSVWNAAIKPFEFSMR